MKKHFLFLFFSFQLLIAKDEPSVQSFFDQVVTSFHDEKWEGTIDAAKKIIKEYKSSALAKEAYYYLGVAYFQNQDYDLANRYLSKYLKKAASPRFFEEVMEYKYLIAEEFRKGAKKHIFSWEKSPTWLPAREDALGIYDEIINTYPHDELAAKSLYGKALLQKYYQDFKEGIDTLQTLLRRFPFHEFAPLAYLEIEDLYLLQCKVENLDPNILELSYVNYQKFCKAFPGEERLDEALEKFNAIKEAFAHNFYETGRFYERTKKKNAATIYYSKVLSKFPETKAALSAQQRLDLLQKSDH